MFDQMMQHIKNQHLEYNSAASSVENEEEENIIMFY